MAADVRTERDPLGTLEVPASALWGIQTERARRNFPISGLMPLPGFVDAVVRIKRAAALTHKALGTLDAKRADAIVQAADEVLAGQHRDQFVVDPYQAGAGTSHNMNVNEVLANRANELLGAPRGRYAPVHPNDHVNQAQSTNDVIPTAIRLAVLTAFPAFDEAASALERALADRGRAFDDVIKAGRTHLQDAMPIRLGQEFTAYAATVARARVRLARAVDDLRDLGIGGTAVGTGVNTEPGYAAHIVQQLRDDTGLALREGADRVQLMQSMGDVAAFHALLRVFASDVAKIANDLRLMASGPRTGLNEIHLPAVQPGSSIMPGKVNPSIVEMVNQVCLQVLGNDATVSAASERGELELNVMMPVIAHNVLFSITIFGNALGVLADKCVSGIAANREQAAYWVERSAALATALAPVIGYAKAAELAKRSVDEGVLIRDLVTREQVLPPDELARLLDLARLTRADDA
jgi:aspartate ammonia-lyase